MAQKRYTDFYTIRSSDFNNRKDLGVVPHGLWRGFDYDALSSGTDLILSHGATGYTETAEDGTNHPDIGLVRTKQGVNVTEDASVTVPVTGNSDPTLSRIDLVVMSHTYVETPGGVAAGYAVITGTASLTPIAPALTFPLTQIVLGQIFWPPATTVIENATYTKSDIPDIANAQIVYRDRIQEITARKKIDHQTGNWAVMTIVSIGGGNYKLYSPVDSNFYFVDSLIPAGIYSKITEIDVPYRGSLNHFRILTLQPLHIVQGTGGDTIQLLEGVAGIFINGGTFFDIWDDGGSFYTDPQYLKMVPAGVLSTNSYSKTLSGIIENKSTASFVVQEVRLDFGGNYYELAVDFADINTAEGISRITGTGDFWNQIDNITKAGNKILLKIINTGVPSSIIVRVDGGTGFPSSSAMKEIRTINNQPLVICDNDILELVEDEDTWLVVSNNNDKGWFSDTPVPVSGGFGPWSVNSTAYYRYKLMDHNTTLQVQLSMNIHVPFSGGGTTALQIRVPSQISNWLMQWAAGVENTVIRCGVMDTFTDDLQVQFAQDITGGSGYDPGIIITLAANGDFSSGASDKQIDISFSVEMARLPY